MPVRVKCRCGQELVLRYGEWVYFLLGLVLLCLVVNSVALLLLYLRLDEAPSAGPAGGPDPLPTAAAPSLEPGPSSLTEPAEAGAAAVPPAGEASVPAPARPGGEAGPSGAGAGARAGDPPRDEGKAPAADRAAAASALPDPEVASILSALPPWKEGGRMAGAPAAEVPPPPEAPWSREAAMVRFLVLARAPEDGLLRHAFLLDPDRRLRRAAADRIRSRPLTSGGEAVLARRILDAAAPYLDGETERAAILRAHGLRPGEAPAAGSGPDLAGILGSLERGASALISEPALAGARALIARVAESGLDVVLLLDVSRSMEGALEPLQRDSLWLLPAIGWTFPGARIGVVLYRDDVEAAEGFAGADSKDLVRALREARADGGGDVPEGVHRAIEEALSLGRFAWRPAAEKHIILIGDAPAPHAELKPLLSLAARACGEGGYRIHAVSVRPEDGQPAVRSFPQIAKSGGGTAVTVTEPERLAEEVFLMLFPPEVGRALRPLSGPLKSLFTSGDA
jgi:hypothetical protein